jgi:hypothetical protein
VVSWVRFRLGRAKADRKDLPPSSQSRFEPSREEKARARESGIEESAREEGIQKEGGKRVQVDRQHAPPRYFFTMYGVVGEHSSMIVHMYIVGGGNHFPASGNESLCVKVYYTS